MLLNLLTALSPPPRLFRGLPALCLALIVLAPDASAVFSFPDACGKKCCRTGAKSCCRHRSNSPNHPALSASHCASQCATRALPNPAASLSPDGPQTISFPPPARLVSLALLQAPATPTLRTFQLFQRPPPASTVRPVT